MKKYLTLFLLFCSLISSAQNFEIYVCDAGNFSNPPWQIVKFDQNGQNPVQFINTNLNWPQDIFFIEDSNQVLISNLGSGRITRHDATTGAFISDFATGIGGPTRMKMGADGYLYVLQWFGTGLVHRYLPDGTLFDEFTQVAVPQSIGLDWDTNGNLYVSSYSGAYVRKFDSAGNDLGLFINNNLLGPTNIWFNDAGEMLVADYNGTSIKRFDSTGTYMGNFITGLMQSEGVDFFPNGNILIGNGGTNSVKMFDSTGMYLQDLIPPNAGNLLNPNAVVIRNVSGSSVPEITNEREMILYPTIGSGFFIHEKFKPIMRSVKIVDLTGKQVTESLSPAKGYISAEHLSEGIYVATVQLTDGKISYQKVVVKK